MIPASVRYAPQHAFPPYPFLPGRDPHPTNDPRGHSYGTGAHKPPYRPPDRWRENDAYLFGVDLYNHGFLWEAHEAWESVWHPTKPDAVQAELLQGLIQCAAASLKIPMEQPAGLAKLAALGTGRLERVAESTSNPYMGLDIASFVRAFRDFAASNPSSIDARPRIELDFGARA